MRPGAAALPGGLFDAEDVAAEVLTFRHRDQHGVIRRLVAELENLNATFGVCRGGG